MDISGDIVLSGNLVLSLASDNELDIRYTIGTTGFC